MPNEPFAMSAVSILVQGTLAKIPGIGDGLAAAWADWDTNRRFQRFESTIRRIQEKLSDLSLNVDPKGDLGMQLLEVVLDSAQRQHSEKKREYLANVLVNAWVSDAPHAEVFNESMLFLRATELFGDSHVAVLHKLHEAGTTASVPFQELAELVTPAEADRGGAAQIILQHLCSEFSFVRRAWDLNTGRTGGNVLLTANLGPENLARNCLHAITARGNRYVDFVLSGEMERGAS